MRITVLGCPVDVVDMATAVERMVALVEQGRRDPSGPPRLVVTLNPEMVMRARREADLAAIVASAALVIPDGIGLVRAVRRRGHRGANRVTGVDLVTAYVARAAELGHRVALAGGAPGVAEAAARALTERAAGLCVVATDPGDPGPEVAGRLAAERPDVILAAYGAGPQERFLAAHLAATGAAVGVGVGGSFDFLSGRVRRAPAAVRRLQLEWLWRLVRQPWRLRRQLVLPRFWLLARRELAHQPARHGEPR